MEKLIIRKATLNDLVNVQELNNSLFDLEINNYDDTLVKDWPLSNEGKLYFEDLITNHYVLVAQIDNEIIGYLSGSINEKGSYEHVRYGEINNMYISDKYRGLNIGKKLINNFKNYCISNGINNLIVTASYKNNNAINFYKKNGFEKFNITLTLDINEK